MVESATLRVRLLGGFAVQVGARCVPPGDWRRHKAAHLVKLLALAHGHRLHREVVIDALWPESGPARAPNNLHQTLHQARRVLEPAQPATRRWSFLGLQGDLIVLSPNEPADVDVDRFRAAAAAARQCRDPEAYKAALARYAGDLLPENRFEDWAADQREELRTLWLALLVEFTQLPAVRGDHQAAIEALATVVAVDPTHEKAQTELIRRYAAIGQRAQAVRQFERFREALRRELDAEPSCAVEQIVRQLLAGRGDEIAGHGGRRDLEHLGGASPGAYAPSDD